jgi:pyrimidine-nucleoside phosphorylase
MAFLPADLIRKKRFGEQHSREEIHFLIQGYAREEIPDYQMSAWLMAICFKGMSVEETAWLTQEMRDSGTVLDLKHLGVSVDKHSTGGLGDKTSLILAPLVAAAGVPVPMMAGRGLAHTGGTLDKLEAISGFNVQLDFKTFEKQVRSLGAAIIGQTREMCPADRKLYALRDVTGTVDSLPLICGSIMSKKLAEGMSALVLDVKFGSGAFMKSLGDAESLARALMDIGRRSGKTVSALLTRMDEPLGRFIGNALEVQECVDLMSGRKADASGKSYDDTRELTLQLAAHMIHLGGKAATVEAGYALAAELLGNGSALKKFEAMCAAQGGDLDRGLPVAKSREKVVAECDGFFIYTDLEKLGQACVHLGAGRRFQSDRLDLAAGLEVFCVQGQAVKKGDTLFALHHSDASRVPDALSTLKQGYKIGSAAVARSPLIAKVLT